MGMKTLFKLFLAASLLQTQFAFAQSNAGSRSGTVIITDDDLDDTEAPAGQSNRPNRPAIDDIDPNVADVEVPDIRLPSPKPATGGSQRPSQRDMKPIPRSMISGATCPLTENRPHADLLEAIANLSRYVKPTPACANDADLSKVSNATVQMQSSAQNLMKMWENPDILTADPTQLVKFEQGVQSFITNLNYIGETISNNDFMKSECGGKLMKGAGIVKAIGDLATAIAPLALLVAAANPGAGAVKAVLGLTTFGSASKVLESIAKDQALDIENADNRTALLENTCEFSKIAQRVRFLKLAQSGQIQEVTNEIRLFKTNAYSRLQSAINDRVNEMITIRDGIMKELTEASKISRADNLEFKPIADAVRAKQLDDNLMCILGRNLAKSANNPKAFPLRAVENYKFLLNNQKTTSTAQSFLIDAEETFRGQLIEMATNKSIRTQSCASISKSYIDAISRILTSTTATIKKHQAYVRSKMNSDKDMANYEDQEQAITQEVNNMTKIGNILERLNEDNSAIDKAEMNTQMNDLKRALFDGGRQYWVMPAPSPVRSWLEFMDEQFENSVIRLNKELSSLIKGACELTKSKCDSRSFQPSKEQMQMNDYQKQQLSQYLIDVKAAQNLTNITPQIAPVGTRQHKVICQKLENTFLDWAASLDYLSAQNFFCQQIESLMDQSVEKGIKNHCFDEISFDGKRTLRKSVIRNQQNSLVSRGIKAKALLIQQKMNVLECQMPDAASISF